MFLRPLEQAFFFGRGVNNFTNILLDEITFLRWSDKAKTPTLPLFTDRLAFCSLPLADLSVATVWAEKTIVGLLAASVVDLGGVTETLRVEHSVYAILVASLDALAHATRRRNARRLVVHMVLE